MDVMMSIRLWGILFHLKKCNLQVSTVAGDLGRAAMSSEHVPNMLDWIQGSGEHAGHSIHCIVSASSMFPPDELYGSGIIILENKGISNGSSASVRPPMLIPPHTIQPALLYCDLHERMR
ncbi:hypothetical protein TNCV_3885811, partial [Trichonephila clavipes]